jgi:hypothetical protein
MFSKRKHSFTGNIAILVCVAFCAVIIPEATHAAAGSSNSGSSSSQDSLPISSSTLSNTSLIISLTLYQIKYILSGGNSSSSQPVAYSSKTGGSSSGSATISDNSDVNKKPKDKD